MSPSLKYTTPRNCASLQPQANKLVLTDVPHPGWLEPFTHAWLGWRTLLCGEGSVTPNRVPPSVGVMSLLLLSTCTPTHGGIGYSSAAARVEAIEQGVFQNIPESLKSYIAKSSQPRTTTGNAITYVRTSTARSLKGDDAGKSQTWYFASYARVAESSATPFKVQEVSRQTGDLGNVSWDTISYVADGGLLTVADRVHAIQAGSDSVHASRIIQFQPSGSMFPLRDGNRWTYLSRVEYVSAEKNASDLVGSFAQFTDHENICESRPLPSIRQIPGHLWKISCRDRSSTPSERPPQSPLGTSLDQSPTTSTFWYSEALNLAFPPIGEEDISSDYSSGRASTKVAGVSAQGNSSGSFDVAELTRPGNAAGSAADRQTLADDADIEAQRRADKAALWDQFASSVVNGVAAARGGRAVNLSTDQPAGGTRSCQQGPRCLAAEARGKTALARIANASPTGISGEATKGYCAALLGAEFLQTCADEMRANGQDDCAAQFEEKEQSYRNTASQFQQTFADVTTGSRAACLRE